MRATLQRILPGATQLQPGDVVTLIRDNGDIETRTVRFAPWQLGHGDWVIGLIGITGGYDLSRVARIDSTRIGK